MLYHSACGSKPVSFERWASRATDRRLNLWTLASIHNANNHPGERHVHRAVGEFGCTSAGVHAQLALAAEVARCVAAPQVRYYFASRATPLKLGPLGVMGLRDWLSKILFGERAIPGVGRNQRCPCGSGKKFKHCCLERADDAKVKALNSNIQPEEPFVGGRASVANRALDRANRYKTPRP